MTNTSCRPTVLLHGTDNTPESHWFPWLRRTLESRGCSVWAPHLPGAERPNAREYTAYLMAQGWDFSDNLIIGHSSGAVEILQLLQQLPPSTLVDTAVLISAFSHVDPTEADYEQLKSLFDPAFRFEQIRRHARKFTFIHAADDPWCPPEQARYLCEEIHGEFVLLAHGGHFVTSLDPRYVEFRELTTILEQRDLIPTE